MKQMYSALAFLLCCTLGVAQTTYYVASDGINNDIDRNGQSLGEAWASLGYTIARASDGDIIIIDGAINQTTQTFINDVSSKSLTIQGQNDATITGDGSNRLIAVTQTNTQAWTFEDITFQNISSGAQGSVFNANNPNLTVSFTNCNFLNNITSAGAGGGAIWVGGATATFTNCNFYNNSNTNATAQGGAIHNQGSASVTITNCTFYQNSVAALGNFNGAAVRVSNAGVNLTINNSLFFDNKSGNGSNSDVNSLPGSTININNSILQYSNNVGSQPSSNLTADFTNTTFTFESPNLTYGAPSSLSDETPIDFGSDNSDVGAWDSQINLFSGSTDSDWATGANWSSATVPVASENATLLSDSPNAVISGATGAVCNNLFVDGGSSLTINSGGTLIVEGTSSGNITYNRNLPTANWYLVASPFAGETMDDMIANNSFNTNTSNEVSFAPYDNSQATGAERWLYFPNTATDQLPSTTGYSAKLATSGNISFTGTMNTDDFTSIPLADNSTGVGNAFNLVGNPYPSYLDLNALLSSNSALLTEATTWLWNEATDSYDIRNLATIGPEAFIAPVQAFFVKANGASSTFIITEAMQSHQNTDSFQRNSNTRPEIELIMSNGISTKSTDLLFIDSATTGFDNGYDSSVFTGISNSFQVYTQLLMGDQGQQLGIQSLPNTNIETMVIPVGVISNAGSINFSAQTSNLPLGIAVILEDRILGTFTRIDEQGIGYEAILSEPTTGTGRFFIHLEANSLGLVDSDLNSLRIFALNQDTLIIEGNLGDNAKLNLYNVLGKRLLATNLDSNAASNSINLNNLQQGIYIVQVISDKGTVSKKVLMH